MPVTVTADAAFSVSHVGSNGVSMAFPDVCKTPTPGGPVPIPYPNVAQSSDTSNGSSTVKMDGSSVMLKGSNFKMSTGDEAGSAMGVVSNKIKGKLEFINYSFDVKVEGKNVCRLSDPGQQNCNSANTVGPFHAQAPVVAIPENKEACEKTQEKAKEQSKAGPAAQWDKSGVIPEHRGPIQQVVDREQVVIYFRATNPKCGDWIRAKHMPKPHHWVKAKTINDSGKAANIGDAQKWLSEHTTVPSVNRGALFASNLAYSPNAKDYLGVVMSLVEGDVGRPLRGLEEAHHALNDTGNDYSGKWMTGDYDLMDVQKNDMGCRRPAQGGANYIRLRKALNNGMGWDGIQHGPQAQWVPRKSEGENVDDNFPERIKGWLNSPSPDPPKVPIGGGRALPACDNCLTAVSPGKIVYLESNQDVKDALVCSGCRNPEKWGSGK